MGDSHLAARAGGEAHLEAPLGTCCRRGDDALGRAFGGVDPSGDADLGAADELAVRVGQGALYGGGLIAGSGHAPAPALEAGVKDGAGRLGDRALVVDADLPGLAGVVGSCLWREVSSADAQLVRSLAKAGACRVDLELRCRVAGAGAQADRDAVLHAAFECPRLKRLAVELDRD